MTQMARANCDTQQELDDVWRKLSSAPDYLPLKGEGRTIVLTSGTANAPANPTVELDGLPFPKHVNRDYKLQLTDVTKLNAHTVQLHYQVVRD